MLSHVEESERMNEEDSSTVAVRRMHPRGTRLMRGVTLNKDRIMERSNSEFEVLTEPTTEVCEKAASRLREIARHLQHDDVPINVIQKTLEYAACALERASTSKIRKQPQGILANWNPTRSIIAPPWKRSSRQTSTILDPNRRHTDEDYDLSKVQPDAVPGEVRDWLATTFTQQAAKQRRGEDNRPRFRSVAKAIRVGIMVD
ncbi:calcium/calmodulin-dependent 3',5'-cyclic nucleotide phosphodiesterase 1A-like, partial [Limulus polyphemus]|uniref:Calcium/calmodulin-dependent 3',5'-cyclic nucleotide phosphodiesterase 1A-like n=1 Tax=Limulus polyphemus TaxID=6850 RepID=A0ABM1TKV0_LIMPO